MRGVVFRLEGRRWVPDRLSFEAAQRHASAFLAVSQSIEDVMKWLGFLSRSQYVKMLAKEKRAIFKRAKLAKA